MIVINHYTWYKANQVDILIKLYSDMKDCLSMLRIINCIIEHHSNLLISDGDTLASPFGSSHPSSYSVDVHYREICFCYLFSSLLQMK